MNEKDLNTARSKIAKFCTYRERATKEVLVKLSSLGIDGSEAEQLIGELQSEGYLNDTRFAKTYAGGKFRLKKWGKLKIKRELRLKGISEEDINTGLAEIEGQNYLETLEALAMAKFETLKAPNLYIRKNKVASYLISKGYESELVWGVLNRLNE